MAVTSNLARYRYISTLGSGGMATVTLAEDTLLGRPVALKRMAGAADARGLSRLRREALLGASVSHPNLVSIYNVVTSEDGELVIVMEYVSGETLRGALVRRGKLPADEAIRILEGVAAGLDTIHQRGIVHRDVKPSNILLGADGTVKVADLGIASVPERTRITTAGSVIGSLSYMAPEQLEDAPSTPAIDVYALAAVAFEVLTGRKARREPNPVALAHAISTQPPPDLRDPWPEAPAAAAELLIGGMSREPAARPRSAGELIGRLGAALEPPSTRPIATPPPAEPPATAPQPAGVARPVVAPPAAPRDPRAGGRGPRPGAVPVKMTGGGRSRIRAAAGALLALLAVAVVLAALLSSGGGSPLGTQAGAPGSHRLQSTRTASHPSTHGAPTAPTGSGSAATSSAGSATTSSASTATSAAAPTPTSPVSAVESFYRLAASKRYADAWALADPTLRRQLLSYQSFQAGQAGDRAISFDAAQIVSQSSTSATVSVKTTSVLTSGTQHCAGTVDLRSGGPSGQWRLHLLHIHCA